MKNILPVFLLFFPFVVLAQAGDQIDSLNYAGIKIAIPEDCNAASEYEIMDCNGTTVQWLYLKQEMRKTVPAQFISQFSSQQNFKRKSEISLKSFGAYLKGFKFEIDNQGKELYKIIAFGTVNDQPLILNVGTDKNIKRTEDLSDFLQQIISIE